MADEGSGENETINLTLTPEIDRLLIELYPAARSRSERALLALSEGVEWRYRSRRQQD